MQTIRDYILGYISDESLVDQIEILEHINAADWLPYYHQSTDFYNKFEKEIWEILENDAADQGESPLKMLDDACMRYLNHCIYDLTLLKNWAAWWALESAAHVACFELQEKLETEATNE